MRIGLEVSWSVVVMALGAGLVACAQAPVAVASSNSVQHLPGVPVLGPIGNPTQGELVREIDDPHTGVRWLLMRNDANPGGPGRFTLVATGRSAAEGGPKRPVNTTKEARLHPVIRAGDRLIVEEHTAVVNVTLEARALSPATLGAVLKARLMIGGKVVRVVALGPGRAELEPQTGLWP